VYKLKFPAFLRGPSFDYYCSQVGGNMQAISELLHAQNYPSYGNGNGNGNDKNINKNITITTAKKVSRKWVQAMADELVEMFNSPTYRPFYLKVAWRLPEPIIRRLIVEAYESDTPARLFNFLAKGEMA